MRLIPWLFFLYILAYLDRVNVSVAQFGMEKAASEGGLDLKRDMIGFGAGIFFWGYWVLEIPSTLSVVKWGARWVFVRILVLWGVCASLCGCLGMPFLSRWLGWVPFLHGDAPLHQFYILRFLLGFFEGGFFPSVIVYLTLWFRPQDRAKAIALFMSAIPISSAVGSLISGLLLEVDWLGLPGWRWIFILEGIVPVFAGFVTLFFLPDRPEKAKWLPPDECAWLRGELNREEESKKGIGHFAWGSSAGLVLLLTLVYFCLNVSSYGLGMFMPAIIKSQSGLPAKWASLLAATPYAFSLAGMLLNGRHSDRTGERPWHVAVSLGLQAVGIACAAALDKSGMLAATVMVICVGPFLHAHLPAFWPIPPTFLGTVVAASAIGFINMVGNLGGSLGPTLVGNSAEGVTSFAPALWTLAPFPAAGAVLIIIVSVLHRRLEAKSRGP